MTINYETIKNSPRLLMEVELKPLQGDRFQPTGFPDLGPARYTLADGTEMLLVESAQSVANRMELACCKDDQKTLRDDFLDLPYVCSKREKQPLTTSYLEAHRLSSPYLLNNKWAETLASEMDLKPDLPLDYQKIAKAIFKYDPCSLQHGVWFSIKQYKEILSHGRVRLTRILGGFIEARGVLIAESGGRKFDKNSAKMSESGNAETGFGTIPFPRTEFTAKKITAYFNLDLALLRGYGLPDNAQKLLIALSLFKVRRFLSTGLRLRTACDLEPVGELIVKRPDSFKIPTETDLLTECKKLITQCKTEKLFADPPVTEVVYEPSDKDKKNKEGEDDKKESSENEGD